MGEVERFRDEFLVEYTYSSNAIEVNTLALQETAMVLEWITIDQKPLKYHGAERLPCYRCKVYRAVQIL